MRAVIMKVGTQSSYAYFVKETKNIKGTEFSVGQKIKFKPQRINGAKWEDGLIYEMSGDMPLVELI
jgi:hypothetical protein